MDLLGSSLRAGRTVDAMHVLYSIYLADPSPFPQDNAPHTAGWLRWFVLGTVILIALLAWACLRGYRSHDSEGE